VAVVLIIEDPYIAEVKLAQLLKDNFYEVMAVSDTEAALAALQQHPGCPLITDIQMPGQNGIEFLEKCIKEHRAQGDQIFIYTEVIDIQTEAALKGLKIFNFYSKKAEVHYLLRGIDRYFREMLQRQQLELLGDGYAATDDTVDIRVAFRELHKGLQHQLPKEDCDTHYELGICDMEMGLINSAIREFQLAARSPDLFQASCYMLARCFMLKNMTKEAIQSLQRGLSRAADGEEAIGLQYEMAIILRKSGKIKEALNYLKQVQGRAGDFLDTNSLISELENELAKIQGPQS
jgi:CheY-like chemotaxis protein